MSEPVETSIAANSVQVMLRASGLVGPSGNVVKNLNLDADGISLKLPAEAFPFISPQHPVMVILSIVQVKPKAPTPAASSLIIPK